MRSVMVCVMRLPNHRLQCIRHSHLRLKGHVKCPHALIWGLQLANQLLHHLQVLQLLRRLLIGSLIELDNLQLQLMLHQQGHLLLHQCRHLIGGLQVHGHVLGHERGCDFCVGSGLKLALPLKLAHLLHEPPDGIHDGIIDRRRRRLQRGERVNGLPALLIHHQAEDGRPHDLHRVHPQHLVLRRDHGVGDHVDRRPQLPACPHEAPEVRLDFGEHDIGFVSPRQSHRSEEHAVVKAHVQRLVQCDVCDKAPPGFRRGVEEDEEGLEEDVLEGVVVVRQRTKQAEAD
mmetsp:Transcript_1133/g.2012  ORF Transcript_1133/g.2012 Transcript_1133/m.2012 type:complete len:287 (+) Transcript_1133:131-991(+)